MFVRLAESFASAKLWRMTYFPLCFITQCSSWALRPRSKRGKWKKEGSITWANNKEWCLFEAPNVPNLSCLDISERCCKFACISFASPLSFSKPSILISRTPFSDSETRFYFFFFSFPSLSISWVLHLKLLWHSDANITIDTSLMGLECKWTGLSLLSFLLSDLIPLSRPNEGKLIACFFRSGRRGYGHVEIGVWGDRGNVTESLQEINFTSAVSPLWNATLLSARSKSDTDKSVLSHSHRNTWTH